MTKTPLAAALAGIILSPTVLAGWKDDVGFTRLQSIVGTDLPTSVSAGLSQVEAFATSTSNYMPDINQAMFSGVSFNEKSGASPSPSAHATTVASYYYSTLSLLPDTASTAVDVYEANHWLGAGFLQRGSSLEPTVELRAIQNHSWIGSFGDDAVDTDVLRRLDYAIDRDGFVCVVGENNGSSTTLPKLLGHGYHVIAVGRNDGAHSHGLTTIDGVGRIRPDLVAPGTATSYSTPVVASAAGVLYEKLQASPYSLSGADLPRTIKALLMASARKDTVPNWDNTSARPLDDVYGAGELNIHHAYMVMHAGRKTAGAVQHGQRGWAAESITSSATKSYFVTIPAGAPSTPFCAALVWHRAITDTTPSPNAWGNPASSMADLNLSLYSATGTTRGSLITQSSSTVDNVEMVFQATLAPGDYEIVVSSSSSTATPYALAWHSLPMVTISATTAEARELDGQDGILTLTRSGDLTYPLYVPITVTGDAIAGTHYQTLPSSLSIPAGQSSATLAVAPIADAIAQGDRLVTISIAADFALVSDAASPATITIKDKPGDDWKFTSFTEAELADPAISGDNADPDGDAIPNLLEYALNLNPKTSNASPIAPGEDSGYLALSVAKNPQALDLTWTAEASSDLSTWTSATIISNTQSTFAARDTVLKNVAAKRMMRIKVTKP